MPCFFLCVIRKSTSSVQTGHLGAVRSSISTTCWISSSSSTAGCFCSGPDPSLASRFRVLLKPFVTWSPEARGGRSSSGTTELERSKHSPAQSKGGTLASLQVARDVTKCPLGGLGGGADVMKGPTGCCSAEEKCESAVASECCCCCCCRS